MGVSNVWRVTVHTYGRKEMVYGYGYFYQGIQNIYFLEEKGPAYQIVNDIQTSRKIFLYHC